ncbi:hypothetical protein TNCT_724471 [Trichonephila clavata]|uniref:Uncharacterized protein n=1 Tax=Trichonephila clavata TaxID=2740835 RepID=A0A8X6HA16_TRICU|nr:hypothetical protein TNCT_724471 [Trichonephila clavata]
MPSLPRTAMNFAMVQDVGYRLPNVTAFAAARVALPKPLGGIKLKHSKAGPVDKIPSQNRVLDVDISRPPDHIGTDELPHQVGVFPGDPQTKKNGIVRGIPGTKRANDDRVEKGRPASGTQRLQNGLVFGDLIISGGHQRVVTVLKGHRKIDSHGLALFFRKTDQESEWG